jgi:hypothetical protein
MSDPEIDPRASWRAIVDDLNKTNKFNREGVRRAIADLPLLASHPLPAVSPTALPPAAKSARAMHTTQAGAGWDAIVADLNKSNGARTRAQP